VIDDDPTPELCAQYGFRSANGYDRSAQSARGTDPTGARAQFVSLASSAQELQGKTVLGSR
jgi:hypothetical protein